MPEPIIIALILIMFFGGLYISITEDPKTLRESLEELHSEIEELGEMFIPILDWLNEKLNEFNNHRRW